MTFFSGFLDSGSTGALRILSADKKKGFVGVDKSAFVAPKTDKSELHCFS